MKLNAAAGETMFPALPQSRKLRNKHNLRSLHRESTERIDSLSVTARFRLPTYKKETLNERQNAPFERDFLLLHSTAFVCYMKINLFLVRSPSNLLNLPLNY